MNITLLRFFFNCTCTHLEEFKIFFLRSKMFCMNITLIKLLNHMLSTVRCPAELVGKAHDVLIVK